MSEPEFEHTVKSLPIDQHLEATVKQLEAEGWQLFPGVTPMAVYHLVRVKGGPAPAPGDGIGGTGEIQVDDTKVHILRDGKLVVGD